MKLITWFYLSLVVCSVFITLSWVLPSSVQAASSCPAEPARQIRVVRENGGRVDWSRSTNLVAFDKAGADGFYDIYIMDATGENERCLTCDKTKGVPQKHNGNPSWHPSGNYLVFQAEKTQHPGWSIQSSPGFGVYNDLWLTDPNGSSFVKLLDLPISKPTGALHPHFSSDGQLLAWSELIEPSDLSVPGKSAGYWALKIADFAVEGNTPTLTNVRTVTPNGTAFYENHGFSPDGTQLLFSSNRDNQDTHFLVNHIYILNLNSEAVTRLTKTGYNEHAQWSPDGKWIVWMSSNGNWGGTDYWMINPDTLKMARLTYFNRTGCPEASDLRVTSADFSWSATSRSMVAYLQTNLVLQQGMIVIIDLPDLGTITTKYGEELETGIETELDIKVFLPVLRS